MARKTKTRQDSMEGMAPSLTCTSAEQVGNLVYVSGTDTVAQADASNSAKTDVVGYILAKPTTTSCRISAQPGPVTGASGLTPGQPVYLSAASPGDVTSTAPSNDIQVGVAISATSWIFYKDYRATGLEDLTEDVTSGDIDAGTRTISNVTTPSTSDQAANKTYVDSVTRAETGRLSMAGPIKQVVLQAAIDTIDIDGLDLDTDGEYRIVVRVKAGSASATQYKLYAGDPSIDSTDANYDTDKNHGAASFNAPVWAENTGIDEGILAELLVSQVDDHLMVRANVIQETLPQSADYAILSVSSFGSITALRLKTSVANGFGIGTSVRVYRLGGALSTGTSLTPLDVKRAADGFDDEFEFPTIDSKWTVVNGIVGTVDWDGNGAPGSPNGVYDLTTRGGWLLMQGGNGEHVELYQDRTLAAGESFLCKLSPGVSQAGAGDGSVQVGISLSDSASGHDITNYIRVLLEEDASAFAIKVEGGGSYSGMSASFPESQSPGREVFLRLDRTTAGEYRASVSFNGTSWVFLDDIAVGDVLTKAWIFNHPIAASSQNTPIQAIDWVRLGDADSLDPWPLVDGSSVQPVITGEWRGGLARRTATQSFNASTATVIVWQQVVEDTDGFFNIGGANPERITIPTGVTRVRVKVQARIDSGSSDATLYLQKNGVAVEGLGYADNKTDSYDYCSATSHPIEVVADDYIDAKVVSTSAGTISDGVITWISVEVVEPIIAITDKGTVNISSADSPYTMPSTKKTAYVTADGATTLNLYALADNNLQEVEIKILSGTGVVTVDGNGAETIEGATTYVFSGVGESRTFKAKSINGSLGWYLVARASLDPASLVNFACTATEAVDDLVYISAADNVRQADADALGTARVIGWIVFKPTATTCLVSREPGPVTSSGLTVGAPVFLSGTAGAATTTPGIITVEVGVAKNTISFIFTGARISG